LLNNEKINQGGVIVTKGELVAQMASEAGISKAAAEKALKAFTGGITNALKKGNKVSLVGFGTFDTSKRAARTGRNPQTGEDIKIPAKNAVKFKVAKACKDAVVGTK